MQKAARKSGLFCLNAVRVHCMYVWRLDDRATVVNSQNDCKTNCRIAPARDRETRLDVPYTHYFLSVVIVVGEGIKLMVAKENIIFRLHCAELDMAVRFLLESFNLALSDSIDSATLR